MGPEKSVRYGRTKPDAKKACVDDSKERIMADSTSRPPKSEGSVDDLGDPDVQADLHNDEDAPQDDATDQANKTNDEA